MSTPLKYKSKKRADDLHPLPEPWNKWRELVYECPHCSFQHTDIMPSRNWGDTLAWDPETCSCGNRFRPIPPEEIEHEFIDALSSSTGEQ